MLSAEQQLEEIKAEEARLREQSQALVSKREALRYLAYLEVGDADQLTLSRTSTGLEGSRRDGATGMAINVRCGAGAVEFRIDDVKLLDEVNDLIGNYLLARLANGTLGEVVKTR